MADPEPASPRARLAHMETSASLASTTWEYETVDYDRCSPETTGAVLAAMAALKGGSGSLAHSESTGRGLSPSVSGRSSRNSRQQTMLRHLHSMGNNPQADDGDFGMASLSTWAPTMSVIRAAIASAAVPAQDQPSRTSSLEAPTLAGPTIKPSPSTLDAPPFPSPNGSKSHPGFTFNNAGSADSGSLWALPLPQDEPSSTVFTRPNLEPLSSNDGSCCSNMPPSSPGLQQVIRGRETSPAPGPPPNATSPTPSNAPRAHSDTGAGARPRPSPLRAPSPSLEQLMYASLASPPPTHPPPSYEDALSCQSVSVSPIPSPACSRSPSPFPTSPPGSVPHLMTSPSPPGSHQPPPAITTPPENSARVLSPSSSSGKLGHRQSSGVHRLSRSSHTGDSSLVAHLGPPDDQDTATNSNTSSRRLFNRSGSSKNQNALSSWSLQGKQSTVQEQVTTTTQVCRNTSPFASHSRPDQGSQGQIDAEPGRLAFASAATLADGMIDARAGSCPAPSFGSFVARTQGSSGEVAFSLHTTHTEPARSPSPVSSTATSFATPAGSPGAPLPDRASSQSDAAAMLPPRPTPGGASRASSATAAGISEAVVAAAGGGGGISRVGSASGTPVTTDFADTGHTGTGSGAAPSADAVHLKGTGSAVQADAVLSTGVLVMDDDQDVKQYVSMLLQGIGSAASRQHQGPASSQGSNQALAEPAKPDADASPVPAQQQRNGSSSGSVSAAAPGDDGGDAGGVSRVSRVGGEVQDPVLESVPSAGSRTSAGIRNRASRDAPAVDNTHGDVKGYVAKLLQLDVPVPESVSKVHDLGQPTSAAERSPGGARAASVTGESGGVAAGAASSQAADIKSVVAGLLATLSEDRGLTSTSLQAEALHVMPGGVVGPAAGTETGRQDGAGVDAVAPLVTANSTVGQLRSQTSQDAAGSLVKSSSQTAPSAAAPVQVPASAGAAASASTIGSSTSSSGPPPAASLIKAVRAMDSAGGLSGLAAAARVSPAADNTNQVLFGRALPVSPGSILDTPTLPPPSWVRAAGQASGSGTTTGSRAPEIQPTCVPPVSGTQPGAGGQSASWQPGAGGRPSANSRLNAQGDRSAASVVPQRSSGSGSQQAALVPPPGGWRTPPPPALPNLPGLLYVDGRDTLQRPVVVINTSALPDQALREAALQAVLNVLQPLVTQEYVLVVVNIQPPSRSSSGSGTSQHQPAVPAQVDTLAAAWAVSAYKKLARPYRKNVKHVVLVAPSALASLLMVLAKPLISKKADTKIKKVRSLKEVWGATRGEVSMPSLGFRFLRDYRLLPPPHVLAELAQQQQQRPIPSAPGAAPAQPGATGAHPHPQHASAGGRAPGGHQHQQYHHPPQHHPAPGRAAGSHGAGQHAQVPLPAAGSFRAGAASEMSTAFMKPHVKLDAPSLQPPVQGAGGPSSGHRLQGRASDPLDSSGGSSGGLTKQGSGQHGAPFFWGGQPVKQ